MSTKLIIVRHGESAANVKNVIAGHLDVPLTSVGLQQAEQTAQKLSSTPIDAIYASDLFRAIQTATPHAERRGLAVITDVDLREICCGRWEGKSREYLETNEADAYINGFRKHYFHFTMPGGESEAECRLRFYNAVLRIAKENEDKTVLIVSHGAVIRSFWAEICAFTADEADEKQDYPSNASYSIVDFDGERFIPIEFSHDSHLSTVTHVHI